MLLDSLVAAHEGLSPRRHSMQITNIIRGEKMKKRKLGNSNLEVSAIGLGCMTMTGGYSAVVEKQEMISIIRGAVERGVPICGPGSLALHRRPGKQTEPWWI